MRAIRHVSCVTQLYSAPCSVIWLHTFHSDHSRAVRPCDSWRADVAQPRQGYILIPGHNEATEPACEDLIGSKVVGPPRGFEDFTWGTVG